MADRTAFYRVALAQLDTKLYASMKARSRQIRTSIEYLDPGLHPDLMNKALGFKIGFLAVSNFINAVGNIKLGDDELYPSIVAGTHLPSSVTLMTLRDALNYAARGARVNRNCFHRYNPFPFAQWEETDQGWFLRNADQIMPEVYDINRFEMDIEIVRTCLNYDCTPAIAFYLEVNTQYIIYFVSVFEYDSNE